jgi:predicted nuclease of predicted toxin-antitoxin system
MMTVRALRERGADAVHLRELGLQTLPDGQILAKAAEEDRVVLTFDLDFGDLLAASGARTPSIIGCEGCEIRRHGLSRRA